MLDSLDELLHNIRLGEDTRLELKTVNFKGKSVSSPRREDLADEMAAIANTRDPNSLVCDCVAVTINKKRQPVKAAFFYGRC